MKAYRVTRAWFGVRVGDVVETDSLHPALASHVEPLQKAPRKEDHSHLEVATPEAPSDAKVHKAKVKRNG